MDKELRVRMLAKNERNRIKRAAKRKFHRLHPHWHEYQPQSIIPALSGNSSMGFWSIFASFFAMFKHWTFNIRNYAKDARTYVDRRFTKNHYIRRTA